MSDDDIHIREGRAGDAEAIRALTHIAYAKWVPVLGRAPVPMEADYEKALQHHYFELLYIDGQFAALIETIAEPGFLMIENLAVLPEFQGRGLGCRLMARAERRAAELGCQEIKLYTEKLMVENVNFYVWLGFEVEREVDFMGDKSVLMKKAL